MSDLIIFVGLVAVVAVVGVVVGMIVAGRIERRMAPPTAELPPSTLEEHP